MSKKKSIFKRICIIVASVILSVCVVSGSMHVFCYPYEDSTYSTTVQNCFSYLVELFGRGSQVVVGRRKYVGFGQYEEEYTLIKPEINEFKLPNEQETKIARVREQVKLKYFSKNLFTYQKDTVDVFSNSGTQKRIGKLTQTGMQNLYATTNTFKVEGDAISTLTNSTNLLGESEFDYGSLLYALKQPLSLKNVIDSHLDVWNNKPKTPVLLTDSLAVKSGNTPSSPCLFLKVANSNGQNINDTAKGYENSLKGKIEYLKANLSITEKLLETELFNGLNVNIPAIYEYVQLNGIEILGYVAIDYSGSSDRLDTAVKDRESDGVSKLIQVNNGVKLFK